MIRRKKRTAYRTKGRKRFCIRTDGKRNEEKDYDKSRNYRSNWLCRFRTGSAFAGTQSGGDQMVGLEKLSRSEIRRNL